MDHADAEEVRELHAVGIYEGHGRVRGQDHGGKARVHIDRPGKSVSVVLTAYHKPLWMVTFSAQTTIERVILGGYERQMVEGIPDSVITTEA